MGDRPIQVGSHYHFVETNRQLSFDRSKAFFKRLDIAAGTAVRFEPGESKTVTLVTIGGKQIVHGGNNLTSSLGLTIGSTTEELEQAAATIAEKGFAHVPQPDAVPTLEGNENYITRDTYTQMYGPTTGDRVRLADTDLWIEVEKDLTTYGEELKFGGGKTVRENMGQAGGIREEEALDLVITNILIVDWSGIYKVGTLSDLSSKIVLTLCFTLIWISFSRIRLTSASRMDTLLASAAPATQTQWTGLRQA